MMFLFAKFTTEIIFVCTIFLLFTLRITCESPWYIPTIRLWSSYKICFWYCQGNQKLEDRLINWKFLFLPKYRHTFDLYCRYSFPNAFIKKSSSTLTICKWKNTTAKPVAKQRNQLKNENNIPIYIKSNPKNAGFLLIE